MTQSPLNGKRVLLGVTGSIAAYKAADLLRELSKRGAVVTVCMTKSATEFVCPLTFEVLSGRGVLAELFSTPAEKTTGLAPWETRPQETARRGTRRPVQHIDAADSDVILIAPATGNIIGKVASGIADDLLSSVVMAARGKVIFAPAMNARMWENPIVQANVGRLRALGYDFVEPESGELACGEEGKGRFPRIDRIVGAVESALGEGRLLDGVRVLVSAGRTEEPVDRIRYISNRSSGKMGYAIASAARDMGARVTLVSGPASVSPPSGIQQLVNVRTVGEMARAVTSAARDADMIFMVAAVSDFAPASTENGKIPRSTGRFTLDLRRTSDILGELGRNKGKKLLVGFAVEVERELERAKEKLKKKNLDLIVVNNPLVEGAGFEVDTNVVTLLDRRGKVEKLPLMSKYEVAREVLKRACVLSAGRK